MKILCCGKPIGTGEGNPVALKFHIPVATAILHSTPSSIYLLRFDMISSPAAVFAILSAVCMLFFYLDRSTGWRGFRYFPPLLWIYALPVVLNNVGVLPAKSAAYDALSDFVLPAFLVLMLISVDLPAALRTMGRGIGVMLIGSFGIVLGGTLAYALCSAWLAGDGWKLIGSLAGSWIGGTANMAATAAGLGLKPDDLGVAILADNIVYIVWLPLLLSSRALAERFNAWAGVDPARIRQLEAAALETGNTSEEPLQIHHVLYLLTIVAAVTWAARELAPLLPELPPVVSTGTWRTLLLTTFALALSFSPARRIPGSRAIGLALVYLFLAGMGARASLQGLDDAPIFLLASFLMIFIHGAVCLLGARLLRVDLHSAAIASAANIGGIASAPIVAAHHRQALVPAAILMAMVGYAAGNYLAVLTAQLSYLVGG